MPGEWTGVVVSAGGTMNASYLTIHNTNTALTAAGNSHFMIDHVTVDSARTFVNLASDGTISHGAFHGLDSTSPAFSINNASPHISDVLMDHGSSSADTVIIGGAASSPVFDHVEITQCHCAFHINQGTNVTVSNSYLHGNAYAFMIEASSTNVQNTNMSNNGINIGDCFGGTAHVSGSYVPPPPSPPMFDATCMGQTNTNPAGSPLTGVGPRP